jgi:hypothetical protein
MLAAMHSIPACISPSVHVPDPPVLVALPVPETAMHATTPVQFPLDFAFPVAEADTIEPQVSSVIETETVWQPV